MISTDPKFLHKRSLNTIIKNISAQSLVTIITRLNFSWSAAGSLSTRWRFAPQGLLGYELDRDAPANIRTTQTPRTIASLKIIVCGAKGDMNYSFNTAF